MIIIDDKKLRDPFVLVENGTYYLYGSDNSTGNWSEIVWACYKNTSGRLDGEWERVENLYVKPEYAEKDLWSPEVHKYNGSYYMFCTYHSSAAKHKVCTILKASSPEGPFVEISKGGFTPQNADHIDATFYLDKEGQPWTAFVVEHTNTGDNIGRMAVAKLSSDLTHLISEPAEIFRADAPIWTNEKVTDGCFMYTMEDGTLLMLWSNVGPEQDYCEAIAVSENGEIDGKWRHNDKPMYSRDISGDYDGGHGMIFTALDGQKYLSLHSPNVFTDGLYERVLFIPVKEENGTLKCII